VEAKARSAGCSRDSWAGTTSPRPPCPGLATNFGLQPLIGRPLGLVSDARLGTKADSSIVVERLLSVSGEDSITIDRKYKEPWTGRLPTRFLVLTNELPRLLDSSGALSSRFVLLVLTKSFLSKENPRLTDELLEEAPGILNWALEGLDRLVARGHFDMPPSSREALVQLEDLSSPVSAFLRDHCEQGAEFSVPVDDLWAAWKAWCTDDNRHPGTKANLGKDLKAAAPMVRKARPGAHVSDRRHVYLGVRLATTTVPNHYDAYDAEPPRHGSHGKNALYRSETDGDGDPFELLELS
jgi:putative DNA primase/helicase